MVGQSKNWPTKSCRFSCEISSDSRFVLFRRFPKLFTLCNKNRIFIKKVNKNGQKPEKTRKKHVLLKVWKLRRQSIKKVDGPPVQWTPGNPKYIDSSLIKIIYFESIIYSFFSYTLVYIFAHQCTWFIWIFFLNYFLIYHASLKMCFQNWNDWTRSGRALRFQFFTFFTALVYSICTDKLNKLELLWWFLIKIIQKSSLNFQSLYFWFILVQKKFDW
jgi:hypothetical protein